MSLIYIHVCDKCGKRVEDPDEEEDWKDVPIDPVDRKMLLLCPECYEEYISFFERWYNG